MSKRVSRRQAIKSGAGLAGLLALTACGAGATQSPAAEATTAPIDAVAATKPTVAPTTAAADPTIAPTTAAAEATTAPTTAALVTEPGSSVKVTYWGSFTGANGEAEQALVDKFNSTQSDVQLDYQFQGNYEETAQKLTAALQAKSAPEVSLLSDVWWFKFYLAKTLQPLDDLLGTAGIDKADYVDVLLNEGVRQGSLYWVPFARSTPLFYYNKELWAEAGLPDRGPETWDEFADWAPKLVKKEGSQISQAAYVHPGAASYIAWLFQGVAWQFGGGYSKPDFAMTMTDPKTVAAGAFFGDSVNKDGWAIFSKEEVKDFVNGVAAAGMFSTGSMGGILRDAQFELGTAFLPKKEKFGCCAGGAGLALLTGAPAEKQQAALKWIAFATSPENQVFWSKSTGYMPVRKSAAGSEEMQSYFAERPSFKTAVDQLPQTQPQDAARVFVPNGDQIIGKGLERIIVTQADPMASFETVNQELEAAAAPVLASLKAVEG